MRGIQLRLFAFWYGPAVMKQFARFVDAEIVRVNRDRMGLAGARPEGVTDAWERQVNQAAKILLPLGLL